MGLLGFLFLSLGVIALVEGSKCVPEAVECNRYWVKLEPHKNLMESERELNSWCRKQKLFFRCVESALLSSENSSELPTDFLISKMFSDDLCSEDSLGRKRYLNNAECINQLNTEYCTLPEYLDIITPDDTIPSKCSLSEKTFSCIAASIVINCGFDAGKVYRYLLKLVSYNTEACDPEGSVPPCEDPKSTLPKREDELAEIFYGLINRIGVIPEQVAEYEASSVSDDTAELTVNEIDESLISQVIRNALDTIDENALPEQHETVTATREPEHSFDTVDSEKDGEDKHYKKTPIISEPFIGLLFYNYSGQEYAIYWRQPDEFPIESVECEHLLPSYLKGVIFRCLLHRRLRDPDCIAPVEKDEPMTPELIRDIDPDVPQDSITDFGARPYWMEELDEYKFQSVLREQSTAGQRSMSSGASNVESTSESTFHAACPSEIRILDLAHNPDYKWWRCPSIFSGVLRKEILSVLLPDLKENDIPLMSAFHSTNVAYVYLYESRMQDFERIVCERVNECHPRGRGVFRCSIIPREIKDCYNCYEESSSSSPAFDTLRGIARSQPDTEPPSSKVIDTLSLEGSGDSEYSAAEQLSDNLITLLLGGDEPSGSIKKDTDNTEDIVAEEDDDEVVAIDISDIAEKSRTDVSSSGLAFMILDRDGELQNDEAGVIAYGIHEEDELTDQNNRATYKLTSDEEHEPLHENILVLQAVQPNADLHDVYEVENREEDQTPENVGSVE